MKTLILELQFLNKEGKMVTLAIDDPIEPVDDAKVNAVMDTIIAQNLFYTNGGEFVSKKGARLIGKTVDSLNVAK